jgi:hypothetical protein
LILGSAGTGRAGAVYDDVAKQTESASIHGKMQTVSIGVTTGQHVSF